MRWPVGLEVFGGGDAVDRDAQVAIGRLRDQDGVVAGCSADEEGRFGGIERVLLKLTSAILTCCEKLVVALASSRTVIVTV